MALEMTGREIYLRHTSTDGKKHVTEHWVWDADRFVTSQQEAAKKLNADAARDNPKAQQLAHVEQITDDQYRKERK